MIPLETHLLAPEQDHAPQYQKASHSQLSDEAEGYTVCLQILTQTDSGGRKKLITCKFQCLSFAALPVQRITKGMPDTSSLRHTKLRYFWSLFVIYLKVLVTCSNIAAYVKSLLRMQSSVKLFLWLTTTIPETILMKMIKEKTDYRALPIKILEIKAINLTRKQNCKNVQCTFNRHGRKKEL